MNPKDLMPEPESWWDIIKDIFRIKKGVVKRP